MFTYKRKFHERKNNFNVSCPYRSTEISQEPIIHDLTFEFISDSRGFKTFRKHTDVSLLFNQERLSNLLGPDNVAKFVQQLNANMSKSSNDVQLSDEDLFKFVKSRHIQTMSELKSWTQYLQDNAVNLKNQAKEAYEKAIKDSVDDTGSTSSNSSQSMSDNVAD